MSFPLAGTPHPAGSATAATPYSGTFIPEIWSGKLLHKFYSSTVLAAISNTDYEGEIRNQGDKVKIRTIPTITIRNYEAEQSLLYERPSAPLVELLIDQGKYFNFILDDVLAVQSDMDQLDIWASDAGEQMKISIDTDVLAGIAADVDAQNKGNAAGYKSADIKLGAAGTPVVAAATSPAAGQTLITDFIVDCGTVLDERDVPETNRWMILPPSLCSQIQKSDLKKANEAGDDTSILRNGRLGMVDRFTIYRSNLLPAAGGEMEVPFGHSVGLTFASQISQMETLRAESTFGSIVRGLNVYGFKVTDGKALGVGIVSKAPAV